MKKRIYGEPVSFAVERPHKSFKIEFLPQISFLQPSPGERENGSWDMRERLQGEPQQVES